MLEKIFRGNEEERHEIININGGKKQAHFLYKLLITVTFFYSWTVFLQN